MASVTLHFPVRMAQCEISLPIMIKGEIGPARLRVALLAVSTVFAFVHIIFPVASDAGRRQLLLGVDGRRVTGNTIRRQMRLTQSEMRISLMVEAYDVPFLLRVAGFALFAETPLVNIVLAMTVATYGRWLVMEGLTFVTRFTTDRRVTVAQRETGTGMVKGTFFPAGCVVAVIASGAQLVFVHVVLAMAGNASVRRFAVFFSTGMTGLAFHFCVQPEQDIVGQRVIESGFVQTDDVRLAPLVFGVAVIAGALHFQPAVISATFRNVSCNVFVAGQAPFRLLALLERHMALGAVRLDVCVAFDYLARHHQRLQFHWSSRAGIHDNHHADHDADNRFEGAHRWQHHSVLAPHVSTYGLRLHGISR